MSQKFKIHSKFSPAGDQPQAIAKLIQGIEENKKDHFASGRWFKIFFVGGSDGF